MDKWNTKSIQASDKHRLLTPEEGEDGHPGIQYNMQDPILRERVSLQLQARFRLSHPPVVQYRKPKPWSRWRF